MFFSTQHPVIIIAIILLTSLLPSISKAQRIDTLASNTNHQTSTIEHPTHSPKKATIMSAILPGLGQAYNKKYWKLPIIYGGFAGLVYSISFADKRYNVYKEAYIDRTDNNPETRDVFDINYPELCYDEECRKYSENSLLQLKDYYQRNLHLSYIAIIGLYVLNIIDANVDAHFFDFNISKDLSLNISPHIYNNTAFSGGVTASLGLTLKL